MSVCPKKIITQEEAENLYPVKIEVTPIRNLHAKPLVRGMNQFYYVRDGDKFTVMKRYRTVEDKPYKIYKTERGARNCAYHMNMY